MAFDLADRGIYGFSTTENLRVADVDAEEDEAGDVSAAPTSMCVLSCEPVHRRDPRRAPP